MVQGLPVGPERPELAAQLVELRPFVELRLSAQAELAPQQVAQQGLELAELRSVVAVPPPVAQEVPQPVLEQGLRGLVEPVPAGRVQSLGQALEQVPALVRG